MSNSTYSEDGIMAGKKGLTMYTFGYWGWGTQTKQLVKAMDAAEAVRGNNPPFFVDIRARRVVRAPGFRGNAFEELLGTDRYRWMPDLGNQRILEHRTGWKIMKPNAASALLDLAVEKAKQNQPVVFFCACPWPLIEGTVGCHRRPVAKLLLTRARKRGIDLTIEEWPGGDPELHEMRVDTDSYKKIAKGAKSIPISDGRLKGLVGFPWGSIVQVKCTGMPTQHVISGPPRYGNGGWYLPLPWTDEFGPCESYEETSQEADELMDDYGLKPMR
jgi:hypothetical protein